MPRSPSTTATPITARASRSRRSIRCWSSAMRCGRIPAVPANSAAGSAPSRSCRCAARSRFNAQMDRVRCRPWGLYGGLSGFGNAVAVHRFGEDEQAFPERQGLRSGARAGRRLHPALRRRRRLRLAARARAGDRSSATCARATSPRRQPRSIYGVVFHDGTLDVDLVRTQMRREEMRKQGLPVNDPETPDAPGEGWSLNLNRRRPQDNSSAQRRGAAGHRHVGSVLLATGRWLEKTAARP